MSKSRQELEIMKKLATQLENYNKAQSDRLDDEQSIRDVLIDQTKQLKFQVSMKKDIRKATNDIYKLQSDLLYEENQVLGTRKAALKIEKDLEKVEKSINALTKNRTNLLSSETKLGKDIANSITTQLKSAEKLKKELQEQQSISKETRNNFGVAGFQGLSEIMEKIGGKASQLAKPFEMMAEASRSTVEPLIKRNKEISKFQSVSSQLNDISEGNLEVTEELGNKLGLVDEKGKVLTGEKAKEAAANALKIGESLGSPMSKARIGLKGLGAGFKSIGGIISKAFGPVTIIITAVKFVKMIVDQMFKASQETADFASNFLMSRTAARELYNDSFKLVANYNQMEMSEGRTVILREDMLKAHEAINNELGLSMNLMTGLGEATGQDVAEVGKLMKHFGLSEKAAGKVFIQAQATGRSVKDYAKDMYGDLALMSAKTGVQVDFNKLINEATGVSGRLRHNLGGTVDNIAKSLFQAKLMGIELNNMQVNAMGLLDIESSLRKEIELEALLGKEIDGDNLRKIAMHGSELDLISAIMRETRHLGGFLNMNRMQQEAFASYAGMSADNIIDIIYNQKEMAALMAKHKAIMASFEAEKNSLVARGIDISDEAAFMEKYNLQQQYELLKAKGQTDEEIKETLVKTVYMAKEEESAGEKWTKTVEIVKEAIMKMVGDGSGLDRVIAKFEGFFQSKVLRLILGISGEDVARDQIIKEIDESKGKAMAAEVQSAVEAGFEFYDPATGAGFNAADMAKDIAPATEDVMGLFNNLSSLASVTGTDMSELISDLSSQEGSLEQQLSNLLSAGAVNQSQIDQAVAGGTEEKLIQGILGNLDTLQTTMDKVALLSPSTGGGLDLNAVSTALTQGMAGATPADLEELSSKFLNLASIQLKEGEVLTEQLLKDQLTPEKFDAMLPGIEDRFKVAVAEEAFPIVGELTKNQTSLLSFMSDFSKSEEDRAAARSVAGQVDERYSKPTVQPGMSLEESGIQGNEYTGYSVPMTDFIQRPGQTPIGFNENDIIIGGTNLFSTGGGATGTTGGGTTNGDDSHLVMLLERLITVVQNGTTIQLDGNKLGQGLVLGSSRIGTTVR
jgi:hypothetical protein